jgi:hypothetical protein
MMKSIELDMNKSCSAANWLAPANTKADIRTELSPRYSEAKTPNAMEAGRYPRIMGKECFNESLNPEFSPVTI